MIIGIDLGTTNSLAGVWREGRAELIPNALGEYLTPSAVSLADDGTLLIGSAARDRLVSHPEQSAAAFKRLMGSGRTTRLGSRELRPEDLSALVLRTLKEDAEHYLGEPVEEAVISVPAYFNDTQRKATRLAGELAGLRVDRLVNEPTAAALAYGLHQQTDADGRRFLVFDLGGGTFDVSILEWFDGVMEVHATAGDNFLGGEDFVEALVAGFLAEHGLTRETLDRRELSLLWAQMEGAKRSLNQHAAVTIRLPRKGGVLEWQVTQEAYEGLSRPLLERLRQPVERSMRDAGLRLAEIDEVVLVGGSTRKTLVQRLVARMFGRLPLRSINPDEVVGLGAAVLAGLKARDAALEEVVLTDVCPYTLGVAISTKDGGRTVDGLFSPILERNTIIPASRERHYVAIEDYQSAIDLQVYQGESPFVRDNVLLGLLRVPLPRLPKEESQVAVRFTYDVNGLLEVEAKVVAKGSVHNLVIEQQKGGLDRAEIARRLAQLAALKVHPRDQAENQAMIARAERLYAESLGDERSRIAEMLAQFLLLLERQNAQEIHRARVALRSALEQYAAEGVLP